MISRFFKGTGPGTIFFTILLLFALWASAFMRLNGQFTLYFDLNPMPLYGILSYFIGTNPLPGMIVTIILVSVMAFLMVNFNTTLFFINERTFLPGFIYVLLSGLFPQYQLLNPAIIGAVFLMIAIRRIMDSYRIKGTAYNFYDAGLLISIGSLFYANLIWFGIITIVGIGLFRTGSPKEIFLSILGLITPYILTMGIYYASGRDIPEFLSVIHYNLLEKHAVFAFSRLAIVATAFAALLVIAATFHLIMHINTKKIQSRKIFSLLLWTLLISVIVYVSVPAVSVEMIWIAAIPSGYLLTHYFIFLKKKLMPEILFSLLLLLIALIQVMNIG
jgi:hypothetical protein